MATLLARTKALALVAVAEVLLPATVVSHVHGITDYVAPTSLREVWCLPVTSANARDFLDDRRRDLLHGDLMAVHRSGMGTRREGEYTTDEGGSTED